MKSLGFPIWEVKTRRAEPILSRTPPSHRCRHGERQARLPGGVWVVGGLRTTVALALLRDPFSLWPLEGSRKFLY